MKIIIIGGGIAGTLAFNFFRNESPLVFDKEESKKPFSSHSGIMRVKSEEIGAILGIKLKKIKVEKWIFYKGKFYSYSTPFFTSSYSQKVSDGIYSRSIENLGVHTRYLFDKDFSVPDKYAKFGCSLIGFVPSESKAIFMTSEGKQIEERYDICINTLPLPFIMELYGVKEHSTKIDFSYKSIYSRVVNTAIKSDKHYTVYLPDRDEDIYRVSLQEDKVILESMEEFTTNREIERICKELFDIQPKDITDITKTTSRLYGKIIDLEPFVRKSQLYMLTEKYNIYSAGRFALWKNIGVDDMLKDLDKIRSMAETSLIVNHYNNRKEDLS